MYIPVQVVCSCSHVVTDMYNRRAQVMHILTYTSIDLRCIFLCMLFVPVVTDMYYTRAQVMHILIECIFLLRMHILISRMHILIKNRMHILIKNAYSDF